MANKLLLLLLTAVAQSGLAQNTTDSCLPPTTIGSDLAALKLGEDMARYGYRYSTQVIFDEILAILAGKAAGRHYHPNSEYAKLRAGLVENRTWTGFLLGTNPTMDAMRLLNTKLDINTVSQLISVAFRPVSAKLLQAIYHAAGHNCEKSKAEITNIFATLRTDLTNAIGLFTSAAVPDPALTLSTEDVNVVECLSAETVADINTALAYVSDGIYLLADALCDPNVKNNVNKYVSQLLAIRKKVVKYFDAEVKAKFTSIRNRVFVKYLSQTPRKLATLMAFEAPYDDYTTV